MVGPQVEIVVESCDPLSGFAGPEHARLGNGFEQLFSVRLDPCRFVNEPVVNPVFVVEILHPSRQWVLIVGVWVKLNCPSKPVAIKSRSHGNNIRRKSVFVLFARYATLNGVMVLPPQTV